LRSHEDMHVARNELLDHAWVTFMGDPEGAQKLGITIAVYAGWRVSLVAFDTRSRVITASAHGRAFALDWPSSHVEFRSVPVAANSAVGFDPAQIDFRFEDRAARLSCRASTIMAPPELLIIQNVRNLTDLVNLARHQNARVISPDPVLQAPQLMTLYDGWLSTGEVQEREITSSRVNTNAVPGGNSQAEQVGMHVVVDAPPKRHAIQQVNTSSGALSAPIRLEIDNQTGHLAVVEEASGTQVQSVIYQQVLANAAYKDRAQATDLLRLNNPVEAQLAIEGSEASSAGAGTAPQQSGSSTDEPQIQVAREAALPVPLAPPVALPAPSAPSALDLLR